MQRSAHARGFTMLEVLVVVAIIALLASIILASLNIAKQRGRDARRINDVRELQNALTLYTVTAGHFPIATATTTLTDSDPISSALVSSNNIPGPALDPLYPVRAYTYKSNSTGSDYTISFCMETDSIYPFAPGCDNYIHF